MPGDVEVSENVKDLLGHLIQTRDDLVQEMLRVTACIAHPEHDNLARLEQELLAAQLQTMAAYQMVLASRIKLYQPGTKA